MNAPRREIVALGIVLLFALGLRGWMAHEAPVIGSDGYWFLRQARLFPELSWREAFGSGGGQHPGYAALVAAIRPLLGGDLERAGYAVSALLGAVTLIPIWGLTRRMAGPVAAISAALLLACLPLHVELSADTMSDAPMLCFALFTLWYGWEAIESAGVSEAAAAGLAGGLAYLTRPEGGGVLIFVGLGLAFSALRAVRIGSVQAAPRVAGLIALPLTFLLVTWPLLLYIRENTGEWRLSMKWSPAAAISTGGPVGPTASASTPGEGSSNFAGLTARFGAFGEALFVANQALKGSHYLVALLAIVGVISILRRRTVPFATSLLQLLLGGVFVLYLALGLVLAHYKGYCGTRHVLILSLIAIPWAGSAIVAFAGWLARRGSPDGLAPRAAAWASVLLVLVSLTGLAKVLRPPRPDQLVFREAGRWIRDQGGVSGPAVCSRYDKIAHYAEGEHEVATGWTFEAIARQAEEKPLDFFVALRSDVEAAGGDVFLGEPPPEFEERRSLASGGDELRIYRVRPRRP